MCIGAIIKGYGLALNSFSCVRVSIEETNGLINVQQSTKKYCHHHFPVVILYKASANLRRSVHRQTQIFFYDTTKQNQHIKASNLDWITSRETRNKAFILFAIIFFSVFLRFRRESTEKWSRDMIFFVTVLLNFD